MEKFFLIDSKMMGPLAGGSKYTVPLEKMLADVKLWAGGVESAGAVQPVTPVVMRANLCRVHRDTTASHRNHNIPHLCRATYLRKQVRIVLQQQLE